MALRLRECPPGCASPHAKSPPGRPVTVQVRVEFTTTEPYTGEEVRYRLIRSCEETPGKDDKYERTKDKLRLLRRTPAGEEDIEHGKEGLIHNLLPPNLADVFFTNGDDVQRFITHVGSELIENGRRRFTTLSDDSSASTNVEEAEKTLTTISRKLETEARQRRGREAAGGNRRTRRTRGFASPPKGTNGTIYIGVLRRSMRRSARTERELDSIRGIGDLETIQTRIKGLRKDLEELDARENDIRGQMKSLLRSEEAVVEALRCPIAAGRRRSRRSRRPQSHPRGSYRSYSPTVSNSASVSAGKNSNTAATVTLTLNISSSNSVLTAPNSNASRRCGTPPAKAHASTRTDVRAGNSFEDIATGLRQQYTGCIDIRHRKKQDLDAEQAQAQTDKRAERVQILTDRIKSNRNKQSNYNRQYGEVEGQLREP